MLINTDRTKALTDQARLRLEAARKASGKGGASNEAIDKAAREFEAVFLAQMMEHMFGDVDFTPDSDAPGDDIYKSMLIDEYSKLMSRSGGIGLADHVKREMLRIQEGASQAAAATGEAANSNDSVAPQQNAAVTKTEEVQ